MSVEDTLARIIAEATRGQERSFRYSFSGAGDPCLRALCYDAQDDDDGLPPAVARSALSWRFSAACGHAVGAVLEAAGVRLGCTSQDAAVLTNGGGLVVRGNDDLTTDTHVIDWKVVGEKSWDKVTRRPKDSHRLQVNGYACALRRPSWALVYIRGIGIFDGSETPQMRVHTGETSFALAQELVGIWESVDAHRKLRTLPERVFNAGPATFPCGWCRHLARCSPASNQQQEEA